MTEEHKKKISIANKGRKLPPKSDVTKSKMREAKLGKKHSIETIQKMVEAKKNITIETRKKLSEKMKDRVNKGIHNLYKGGITPVNRLIRECSEYKLWRKAVFERDNYTCIFCKRRGVKLEADHIKPFSLYPELRFAIDNGRTLCKECHKTTDSYGYRLYNKKRSINRLNK